MHGLVGSQYYAAHLTHDQVNRIDVMIDTDMIASPNYVRLVYDGNGDELGPAGPEGPAPSSRSSRTTSTAT
jgi:Zn-dependent M28 family amino/carboxypeptidase